MLCPGCGVDYSESYGKIRGPKRKSLGPLYHFMMPYQIKGIYCPDCGTVMEFVTSPTGNLFHKRSIIKDEKLLYITNDYWTFLTQKDLLDEFREFVSSKRNVPKLNQQQDLFINSK